MQDFKKLRVWQEGNQLALDVMRALGVRQCDAVPGLRAQAVRAAVSVPTNIAEGCGKTSPLELARYAEFACGSLSELEAQLLIAHGARIITDALHAQLSADTTRIRRMLFALTRTVRRRYAKDAVAY